MLYVCQNLVIQTRSVEFMPFYLSLSTFLMSISFSAYGMLKSDPFIYVSIHWTKVFVCILMLLYYNVVFFPNSYFMLLSNYMLVLLLYKFQVPNGIGSVLGAVQLVLYGYYSRSSEDGSREPLIVSYAWICLK